MGQEEIEAYLNHMVDGRKVSASTQSIALSAIAFLYREVLSMDMPCLDKLRRITHIQPDYKNVSSPLDRLRDK